MAGNLRYDNQVIVVTGAGNGLGKQYAKFFASRGAKVVVNDLGGTFNGKDKGGKGEARVADAVVKEIQDAGGIAVANYDPVQNGEQIIKTAIETFGTVHVVINNAGILRDVTLRNMTDADWDSIVDVHVHGSMKTARAAWPFFKKQRYGRIINTSSASGLFANFGQSNYAAAKMAVIGLSATLAKEGAKYNIHSNSLAPGAASRLTQTVWSPEMMEVMKPDYVVPLVGVLCHELCKESGSIFEAAAGHYSKIRWERSKGFLARPDENLTPDLLLQNWKRITDFANPDHPNKPQEIAGLLEKATNLPQNTTNSSVSFKGRVALVTGGGAGLGRAYALQLAKLGAKVFVNDVKNAEKVAAEITSAGGEAGSSSLSVEDGQAVVRATVDRFGRLDILVNNAGILADKAFQNMTDQQWYSVMSVHLRATYAITRAAWPFMMKQRYGRIVSITSTSGIYGNFGQANYATAKSGIIGFARTIAREGAKYNIISNILAPTAGTDMTRTVWPESLVQAIKPEFVAPLVAALCSEKPPVTGQIFEAGGGWFAMTRWQRARGYDFDFEQGVPSVEAVAEKFSEICNFDNGKADNPDMPSDGSRYTMGNVLKHPKIAGSLKQEDRVNRRYLSKIQEAKSMKPTASEYSYTDRDVLLYNLSLGARHTDLPLIYEGDTNFQVLPTFGIVPTYFSTAPWSVKDIVPNYDLRRLLHGEQYLEIRQFPIPTAGTLSTTTHLVEVIDKGNAALVRRGSTTTDTRTGSVVFYNESVSFIRGAGGFGGARKPSDRGAATADNTPPNRPADAVVEERTSPETAALYRLMGDRNPLHVDPEFSAVGGFKEPILHGLATFGISGKHVFQTYGMFKNIKVRFSGTVLPGQTIVTEMWKEGAGRVVYRVKVKETGKVCISNAAVELVDEGSAKSKL